MDFFEDVQDLPRAHGEVMMRASGIGIGLDNLFFHVDQEGRLTGSLKLWRGGDWLELLLVW